MSHTLSSPDSGRQSGLQIRFTHRCLSTPNGKSDFVAHTAGVPPSALGAVAWGVCRETRKVCAVGVGRLVRCWLIWGNRWLWGDLKGGFLPFVGGVCGGWSCVRVWSLVVCMETRKPLWGACALWFSGNSLGFRGLGCFGADYCTFRNLECAFFGGAWWGGW